MPADKVVKEEYALLKLPLFAGNVAASRKKRLYASAVQEYVGFKSRELQAGEWLIDPSTGDFMNSKGQTVFEDLEFTINDPANPRAHWEIPQPKVEEAEAIAAIWTSGNMTARSARYKALLDYHKSPKLADIAFAEEAARHGVTKPFSDEVGTKPSEGKPGQATGSGPSLSQNPWSDQYLKHHSSDDALREQTRIIKTGSALARNLAKTAGVNVFGGKL